MAGIDGVLPADGLYVDEREFARGLDGLSTLPLERPPGMYALSALLGSATHPERARAVMSMLSLLPALGILLLSPSRGFWRWVLPLGVAVEPVLALFGTRLLPAVPAAVLVTFAVVSAHRGRWHLFGALMGLACLFRAELLLGLPLLLLASRRGRPIAASLSWAAIVLPVMLLNLGAGAGPVIAGNGSLNLWLGTEVELMETPPGVEFEELMAMDGDDPQLHFMGRWVRAVYSDPLGWVALGIRKLAMTLSVPGPGRNLELRYLIGRAGLAPLLAPMLALFSLGLVRVFRPSASAAGMATGWRSLALVIFIVPILFLPAARYRLALMPVLWAAAATSVPGRGELTAWCGVGAALVALSLLSPTGVRPGLTEVQRAERMVDLKESGKALEALRIAEARGYEGADRDNLAGIALCLSGNAAGGLERFRRAAEVAPHSPTVWKNTAVCLAGMGRRRQAVLAATRAVELNGDLVDDLAPLLTRSP